ncbi:MAG TPA: hypothetical protein VGO00_17145 [Kofleriaceae bacterium]|nr:hypothetical protein [Kofleriaceae bacterium]
MVSARTYEFMLWGGAALAFIGLVGAIVRESLHSSRTIRARSNKQPPPRRKIIGWMPLAWLIIGVALVVWAYGYDLDVLVVSDGDSGEVVTRLGVARGVDPDLMKVDAKPIFRRLWVENRSSREVRVETVQYGGYQLYNGPPPQIPAIRLPPNSTAAFDRIEHIGPNDVPPDKTMGDSYAGASKIWLTW